MSQDPIPQSIWSIIANSEQTTHPLRSSDLVMAWAIDKTSSEPRYIFELDANHKGANCDCICVSCKLPLIAVNVAKTEYLQRPHFKHRKGAQRNSCLVLAARFAIAQQLLEKGYIELPQRRVSSHFIGLSGKKYEAWEVRKPERVKVIDTEFQDKALAILTLDDGRKIQVELTGTVSPTPSISDPLVARIIIDIGNDLSVAGMSPEELKAKMTLLWDGACWHSHWADSNLIEKATEQATTQAVNMLDWLVDDGTIPGIQGLTHSQKSETLLHLEVKKILAREKRINLPELEVKVSRALPSTKEYSRQRLWPAEFVKLHDVQLEKRVDKVTPDVVAQVYDTLDPEQIYTLLIEVTVTNVISDERKSRIAATNLPTLEIDIGRMGGIVSKDDLTFLVIEELVTKRWLYHPKAVLEANKLGDELDAEIDKLKKRDLIREKSLQTPLQTWINRFEEAYIQFKAFEMLDIRTAEEKFKDTHIDERARSEQMWLERLEDCIYALRKHGFPEVSLDWGSSFPSILNRLFSIKFHAVVGYKLGTCWQVINTMFMDYDNSKRWHTLYLIAINEYHPPFTSKQALKVENWRNTVIASIKSTSPDYLRSTRYDRFLSLLFPEMKTALESQFGKQVISSEKQKYQEGYKHQKYTPMYNKNEFTDDLWLKGKALEKWIRENPQAAKNFFDE